MGMICLAGKTKGGYYVPGYYMRKLPKIMFRSLMLGHCGIRFGIKSVFFLRSNRVFIRSCAVQTQFFYMSLTKFPPEYGT